MFVNVYKYYAVYTTLDSSADGEPTRDKTNTGEQKTWVTRFVLLPTSAEVSNISKTGLDESDSEIEKPEQELSKG